VFLTQLTVCVRTIQLDPEKFLQIGVHFDLWPRKTREKVLCEIECNQQGADARDDPNWESSVQIKVTDRRGVGVDVTQPNICDSGGVRSMRGLLDESKQPTAVRSPQRHNPRGIEGNAPPLDIGEVAHPLLRYQSQRGVLPAAEVARAG